MLCRPTKNLRCVLVQWTIYVNKKNSGNQCSELGSLRLKGWPLNETPYIIRLLGANTKKSSKYQPEQKPNGDGRCWKQSNAAALQIWHEYVVNRCLFFYWYSSPNQIFDCFVILIYLTRIKFICILGDRIDYSFLYYSAACYCVCNFSISPSLDRNGTDEQYSFG